MHCLFNPKPKAQALVPRVKRLRTNLRSGPGFGLNDGKTVVNAGFAFELFVSLVLSCNTKGRRT